ncbi:aspartic peptidase domain-containing protein [Globomyces pollinis-pini]|nr:aspartic peptidase domain-containing protein [Globomyces pollinis-pini]
MIGDKKVQSPYNYLLFIDTGSSDIWVRGSKCVSTDWSCKTGEVVTTSDKSLVTTGKTFKIAYGDGSTSCSGVIYRANVTIGTRTINLPVGITTKQQGTFDDCTDGMIGMAFNQLSFLSSVLGGENTNYLDTLKLDPPRNMFSMYSSNFADGDASEISFGGINPNRYTGTINYVKLVSTTTWDITMKGATYQAGTSSGNLMTMFTSAAVDSGTSMIVLEAGPANAINKFIGAGAPSGATQFSINCAVANTGPTVILNIDGKAYPISSKFYVTKTRAGKCYSAFSNGAELYGVVILGTPFMRAYYTVFDRRNMRVGFAPAKHP